MAVCKTDMYGNLTQYRSYQVIDQDSSYGKIKIIDDRGAVLWVDENIFHIN